MTLSVAFRLNGRDCTTEVRANRILLDLLREEFDCLSLKSSCDRGVCGSCTCLINSRPVASCSVFAFEVDGAVVETIEGMDNDGLIRNVQRAFIEGAGFQCGYCTPGMIMLATGLLRDTPKPDVDTIRKWLDSNICRCTGYQLIIESVARAVDLLDDTGAVR